MKVICILSISFVNRRWWVHPELLRRDSQGGFLNLMERYKDRYPDSYFNALRISPQQFDHLFTLVKNRITKSVTMLRQPIDPQLRLTLTLMFLASGDSIKLLAMFFRLILYPIISTSHNYCIVPAYHKHYKILQNRRVYS